MRHRLAVSSEGLDPKLRHRHDVGDVAHNAETTSGLTHAIQALLGIWIAGTLAVAAYALVMAGIH